MNMVNGKINRKQNKCNEYKAEQDELECLSSVTLITCKLITTKNQLNL